MKVIEMSTGKIVEDEFGAFEDEVLNAGWTPAQPELPVGLRQPRQSATAAAMDFDVDAFLAAVYCSQQ